MATFVRLSFHERREVKRHSRTNPRFIGMVTWLHGYIAILLYCYIVAWLNACPGNRGLNCYADLDTLLQPTPTHSHVTPEKSGQACNHGTLFSVSGTRNPLPHLNKSPDHRIKSVSPTSDFRIQNSEFRFQISPFFPPFAVHSSRIWSSAQAFLAVLNSPGVYTR
jgi:hypothetical protein